MTVWVRDTCPISEELAERNYERAGDFAEYLCPSCGGFRITNSALAEQAGLTVGEKLKLLDRAKRLSGPGQPVTIATV